MTEQRGDEYINTAKKLRDEESIKNYIHAGNQFNISECYLKAGDAFAIAAQQLLDKKENYRSAAIFSKAGENYVKIDNSKAKICLDKSVDLFVDNGNMAAAAKKLEILAMISFNDKHLSDAAELYEKAQKYWNSEDSPATGYQSLLKAEYILIDIGEYNKAVLHLERIGSYYKNQPIMIVKCREIFFEIGILKLYLNTLNECNDFLIENSVNILSMGHTFLKNLINAINNNSGENFHRAINDYMLSTPLHDPLKKWQMKILLETCDGNFKK